MNLDPNTDFGARVLRRLEEEEVAWLTTVGASSGTPRPAPIWFLWDKATIRIFSEPNQAKLKNIARHPQVSFNFNGDAGGGDIIVLTGAARIDPAAPAVIDLPADLTKYHAAIPRIGLDPQRFSDTYSTAIIFTPERVTGH